MIRKRFAAAVLSLLAAALVTGCGKAPEKAPEKEPAAKTTVTYMGQASLRIATPENKVIYIDPFSGEEAWYEPAADLILVTHGHRDHNQTDLIKNRSSDCRIITHEEALKDGVHQTFDLDYVTVEAVEACNENHPIDECVGYILTFPDGRTLYVSGDTSTTEQMASLADRHLDYAFFCGDGKFNMDIAEASACAKLVAAKHSIPYHMAPGAPNNFDREIAEQFEAEGRIILEPGETLTLE
ncbi:MAG: MBL fold metallo-hydrolase [Clostridium sp.]|nr:MBL fold metallo-hydrolase [Clostridium sp.]